MSANLISLTSAGGFSTTGNVVAGNIFGNGSQLTGIVASPSSNIVNGNSNVSVATGNGNVTITSNGTNTWNFDTTGNLIIPSSSGGLIKTEANGAIAIAAMNNGTDNPAQLMSWRTTENNPDTIVSTYANSATVMTNVTGTLNTWTFDNTGNLTLPGNMIVNGNINTLGTQTALLQPIDDLPLSFIATGANGSITSFWAEDFANLMTSNIAAVYTPLQNSQTVRIVTGNNGGNIAIYDFDQLGMFTTTDVCATGNIHAGNLILNSNIIGTGASPAPSLSGFSSVSAISLSASGNITGGNLFGNGSQLTGISYANISNTPPMVSPSNELHVAKNGNDTTGNGDVLNPYLTINKAVTMASNSFKIIVHAGEYTEDVTINNFDFLTITSVDAGGVGAPTPTILGNLIVSGTSASTAIKNVGINEIITHSASGSLYLTDLSLGQSINIGTLNKTGSGYLSIQNCNLGIASGNTLTNVNITGSGTVVFNNTQLAEVTINNASASVSIVNNSNTLSVTLTAGTLNVFDSYMYTLGNSGFYAVNATGGVLQIRNSILVNPNQTPARVNLASPTVFAYDDIYFDRANSTLGISANATVDFQSVRLSNALSVTGNITGNYIIGNGSQLTQVNAVTVDVTDTNGLTTVYYPTFVENRTTAQIARADVDLTYRTDDNLLTVGNVSVTGNITGNTAGFAIGYRDIPQVSFTGNATIATTDAGKHYYSTLSTGNVLTIANNASQSFQVGTAISIVNQGTGNITVAQGSGVTLYLAGNATSGNRTVATFGMATIMKVATDTWFINGTGVS